jgi:hypothetical protein
MMSERKVKKKSDVPKNRQYNKPLIDGAKTSEDNPTSPMQITATVRTAFLAEGKKNMDELCFIAVFIELLNLFSVTMFFTYWFLNSCIGLLKHS